MEKPIQAIQENHRFTAEERRALYKAVLTRRDVRGQFLPDPIPDEVLARILTAAHHAPSVGFMQPWNFLVVRSGEVKKTVHDAFLKATAEAAEMFEGERARVYPKLNLEGILESPVNLCITCDRSRTGPVVVGRTHIPVMDIYSSVCAVQNLWLAARAEGVGVGWVSIFDNEALRETLGIPDDIVPVAYLCLGYVSHFFERPELETAGWQERLEARDLLYFDQWGQGPSEADAELTERVAGDQQAVRDSRFLDERF